MPTGIVPLAHGTRRVNGGLMQALPPTPEPVGHVFVFEQLYDDEMVASGDVPAWWAGHQRILNARAVPARFTRCEPVPVRVRLRWADDGVQHLDTHATAWTTPLVLIRVDDPRSVTRGVWVPAADVTRLDPGAEG